MINSNVQSFQNGVDTLYNKCVSCGSTPTAKTPAAISTAIQSIYTNRYNAGYNAAGGDVKHTVSVGIVSINEYKGQIVLYVDGVAKSTGKHGNFYGTAMLDRIPAAITV